MLERMAVHMLEWLPCQYKQNSLHAGKPIMVKPVQGTFGISRVSPFQGCYIKLGPYKMDIVF